METSVEQILKRQRVKKFTIGFVVILAGLLLLAFNFDFLPQTLRHILFSWQVLLIVIGVISLVGNGKSLPGMILIFIGAFFLIPRIFALNIAFTHLFWPLILIGIGLLILSRSGHYRRNWQRHFHKGNWNEAYTIPTEEGYINETNLFSGSKHKVINQVFRGGKVSNIFGGTEIDLTHATLPEGQTELNIECIFGGVTLIVPDDWKVVLNISAIMGGFSDKRLKVGQYSDTGKVLVIRGSAIFGGGEIKCC
ncbi:MAG: LiaF-related protein [Bacteroidetes bacterium]|nr:LiaF-related protein [Bacteroidota bacterium]